MNCLFRVLAAGSAFALGAGLPTAAAAAEDYDTALHDTLLDCMTLNIMFAQVGDTEAQKKDSANMAVGYLNAAQKLSGVQIKNLSAEVDPRKARILGWLNTKDPRANRLTKSCATILVVGKTYIEAGR